MFILGGPSIYDGIEAPAGDAFRKAQAEPPGSRPSFRWNPHKNKEGELIPARIISKDTDAMIAGFMNAGSSFTSSFIA